MSAMVTRLNHRGPDHTDTYEDDVAAIGHTRLAILDLSAAGRQPMIYGTRVITFNGEIYNHKSLRNDLDREFPGVWHSRSDTETLLRAVCCWGDEVVTRIGGMFAFAVWDAERQRLFCARDPFGKKPLYYWHSPNGLAFASEVEALMAALNGRPNPDPVAMSSFLLRGYSPAGGSIYSGVSTLKGGQCLSFEAGTGALRTWTYSEPKFSLGQNRERVSDVVSEVEARFRLAVERRLLSDAPVGLLLSGGVDSTLVCLEASRDLTAFTAVFPGSRNDESRHAQHVAKHAGLRHRRIDVTPLSFPDLLQQVVQCFGEPFGDSSAIPAYNLFQGLKHHVKVALTGDGGDEVFAGYTDVRLFWLRKQLASTPWQLPLVRRVATLLTEARKRPTRLAGFLLAALTAPGDELFTLLYREGWTRAWRRSLMRPEAWLAFGEDQIEKDLRSAFREAGDSDLERYLNVNLERLTQCFLVKIDRTSMAHSIEARCPMLDIDLFDCVRTLSVDVLLAAGQPKSVPKRMVAKRLGRTFAYRRKMGFSPPLGEWLAHPAVSQWVETNLTDGHSYVSSLVSEGSIHQLLTQHAGGQDQAGRLWRLLFLNAWHARYYGSGSARVANVGAKLAPDTEVSLGPGEAG